MMCGVLWYLRRKMKLVILYWCFIHVCYYGRGFNLVDTLFVLSKTLPFVLENFSEKLYVWCTVVPQMKMKLLTLQWVFFHVFGASLNFYVQCEVYMIWPHVVGKGIILTIRIVICSKF